MSAPRQPQDHKLSAKSMLREAVSLQAANLLQKAQLDMMATKIILSLKAHKSWVMSTTAVAPHRMTKAQLQEDLERADKALDQVRTALGMTRDEATAARSTFVYPDERIQAVINRATEEIADILLEDVG